MQSRFLFALIIAMLAITSACQKQPQPTQVDPARLKMFAPLPDVMPSSNNPITEEKVALGRMLYYETRLSKGHNLSCNSCHLLDKYGVDNDPTSIGHKGQRGDRNSPTSYNAAGHSIQFWDGRAKNVEEQAKGPILNPVEMAAPNEKYVLDVLNSIPEYVDAFKKAFPEDKKPVSYENLALAIGAFERKLVTPSRWDKFLEGDQAALTEEEKTGFNKFVEVGCQACHLGPYVGGAIIQKLGVTKPYPDASDPGREKVTKSEGDRMMFKVPSLRNIEKTYPYLHNGKVGSLEEVIGMMGDYQLGRQISPEDAKSIATWLKSLTGEIPTDYIKPPQLPPSTAKTPKPTV